MTRQKQTDLPQSIDDEAQLHELVQPPRHEPQALIAPVSVYNLGDAHVTISMNGGAPFVRYHRKIEYGGIIAMQELVEGAKRAVSEYFAAGIRLEPLPEGSSDDGFAFMLAVTGESAERFLECVGMMQFSRDPVGMLKGVVFSLSPGLEADVAGPDDLFMKLWPVFDSLGSSGARP